MAHQLRKTFQLKVTLMGIKPPVWRRILVSDSTTLTDLHHILQVVMGWTDSHLHQFMVGQKRYGIADPEWDVLNEEILDESNVRLKSVLRNEKNSISYEYDFGDGWLHKIILEKKLNFSSTDELPKCVTGRRGCPPEDVGGVWGYENFLNIYQDDQHPEHDEMVEWSGEYFHPENLDIEEINEILHESF